MTLQKLYLQDVESEKVISDPAQLRVIESLQTLHDELCHRQRSKQGFLAKLISKLLRRKTRPAKGIYLWGGVGRGKTYLVDMFFDSLPFEKKLRIHFHRFMQRIHRQLGELGNIQNPLLIVADKIAAETSIICFDEFHVSDITDAMLLGGLFSALFDRGVSLVATSNQEPDKLYWDGLQRERFLPAIDIIKENTTVINIEVETDYRLRILDQASTYHFPLDEQSNSVLEQSFLHIAPDKGRVNSTIEIENRKINVIRFADGVVWFEFRELCDGPRGADDYIEIARQFQTVLVSNVTRMGDDCNDIAKRFITMIDEFYDRNVKLLLTAAVEISELYSGKRFQAEFTRTTSRLTEMQSHEYLALPHLTQ